MVTPRNEKEVHFFESLEQSGEEAVRADLALTSRFSGRAAALAQYWLNMKDRERADARESQWIRSVQAAEHAAVAAKESARWAKWATICTAIGSIGALLGVLLAVCMRH